MRSDDPNAASVRTTARVIARLVKNNRNSRLTSVFNGTTTYYDDDDNPVVVIDDDGVNYPPGKKPPKPTPPTVKSVENGAIISHDGTFVGANTPKDFAYFEVHVSDQADFYGFPPSDASLVGVIYSSRGGQIFHGFEVENNPQWFVVVAVSKSDVHSDPSDSVPGWAYGLGFVNYDTFTIQAGEVGLDQHPLALSQIPIYGSEHVYWNGRHQLPDLNAPPGVTGWERVETSNILQFNDLDHYLEEDDTINVSYAYRRGGPPFRFGLQQAINGFLSNTDDTGFAHMPYPDQAQAGDLLFVVGIVNAEAAIAHNGWNPRYYGSGISTKLPDATFSTWKIVVWTKQWDGDETMPGVGVVSKFQQAMLVSGVCANTPDAEILVNDTYDDIQAYATGCPGFVPNARFWFMIDSDADNTQEINAEGDLTWLQGHDDGSNPYGQRYMFDAVTQSDSNTDALLGVATTKNDVNQWWMVTLGFAAVP